MLAKKGLRSRETRQFLVYICIGTCKNTRTVAFKLRCGDNHRDAHDIHSLENSGDDNIYISEEENAYTLHARYCRSVFALQVRKQEMQKDSQREYFLVVW